MLGKDFAVAVHAELCAFSLDLTMLHDHARTHLLFGCECAFVARVCASLHLPLASTKKRKKEREKETFFPSLHCMNTGASPSAGITREGGKNGKSCSFLREGAKDTGCPR